MAARVSIAGHPIHPMLVVVPATLIVSTAVLDVLSTRASGGDARRLGDLARWTNRLSVASGALAGTTGLADWTALREGSQARGLGRVHGLGNALVLALFGLALRSRDGAGRPSGRTVALTVAGAGLAMLTAWLGGELVFRHGVGVDDDALDAG